MSTPHSKSTPHLVPGDGRNYWRSLQELADSDEFRAQLEKEFPTGIEPPTDGVSRRRFLQIMAASAALAGLAGCRWPEEHIVPFAKRPAGMVPGETQHFATAFELGGVAIPMLATSYDGRPIKVDGNPDHPWCLGGGFALAQATVLDLYDVDRSRNCLHHDGHQAVPTTWEDVLALIARQRESLATGRGLAVLAERSSSPTRQRLRRQLQDRMPSLRWFEYEPIDDADVRDGAERAFGRAYRDVPHLEKARIIADFDANLLQDHPGALRNARMFARGRRPEAATMNRLYVFEPGVSPTGSIADHRVPTARVDVPVALGALAAAVFDAGVAVPAGAGFAASDVAAFRGQGPAPEVTAALAEDLVANRGHGFVAVGDRQPAGAHHLVHVLNVALGNAGRTVTFRPLPTRDPGLPALTRALEGGEVDTLVILGGNPVTTAPADVNFAAALARAKTSLHLSSHVDDTSRRCTWHVPRAHYLEAWGDAVAADGSVVAVQPLIEPLFGGRSDLEVLAALLGEPGTTAHASVRTTFHQRDGGRGEAPHNNPRFEERWRKFLHDGFVSAADGATVTPPIAATSRLELASTMADLSRDNLELIIKADPCLYDGRFANNAWLQEMPEFSTKLVWDNVATMSPATAEELGVKHGDMLELTFQGRKRPMPCYVLPGHAAHSVTVTLGYGRSDVGRVGKDVGHDVYGLRTGQAPHGGIGLTAAATGATYPLSVTQDHQAIDPIGYKERERRIGSLVREATVEHYEENPEFVDHLGIHHPPLVSLWKEKQYTGHKWGMAVDLNVCTGCSACIVACQAENNIPVVGKDEVSRSREMHWIRVDRYFKGDPENPEVAAQPVTCAHCEMAPCEGVCPVAATMHTNEGLNVMVYNRCVGTRYCENNCPYKVRRFNFFNNIDEFSETQKLVFNPEVTLRSRGVMEKCSYCVQRIQNAKIKAKDERRPLQDGEIVPACAQTCPTEAIVFGDLNDPNSRVSHLREDKRSYDLLAYLNIRPRTHYMARIRNPHPRLAEAPPPAGHDEPTAAHDGGHDETQH